MTFYLIRSPGEAELGALTLLGASTKRGDDSQIGFFGSGFKYAIATLLRERVGVRLFFGAEEITVSTVSTTFRGQAFEQIHINGQPTSLTTGTGPQWGVRDAFREIYSNALDEAGSGRVEELVGEPAGLAGFTTVCIEFTHELKLMMRDRSKFFLSKDVRPLLSNERGELYWTVCTGNEARFFRRGIWVYDRDLRAVLSYNFTKVNINEARKAEIFDLRLAATYLLVGYHNLTFFLNLPVNSFEWGVLDWHGDRNWAFVKTLQASYKFIFTNDNRPRPEHQHLGLLVEREKFAVLNRFLPTYHEWFKHNVELPWEPSVKFVESVEAARESLRNLGVRTHWPISYVNVPSESLGFAKNGICYMTQNSAKLPNRELRKTLLEEFIHLDTGAADFSREFQEKLLEITMNALEVNNVIQ